ncbi:MAG: four helix bundle protein [Bacteroidota bacterium]|nr:four helix bundle protein [Bacteroidota bacterium]
MRKEIENRIIDFSVEVINLSKSMGNEFVDKHMANQIIRSSTSAALNYGEVQGAESRNDFIHKTSVVLKELRETHINNTIISKSKLKADKELMAHLLDESNQLVAIFHKTVMSARKNRQSKIDNRKSINWVTF